MRGRLVILPDLGLEDIFDLKATALPVAFDIVWCKYPHRQRGKGPGPTARPCLVRRSFTYETTIRGSVYDVGYVDVIYGTKQIDKFAPPQGFHVSDADEKKVCGLTWDTVFDLQDHMPLPWSPIYFSSEGGKPIISGRFSDPMKERLKEQAKLLTKTDA